MGRSKATRGGAELAPRPDGAPRLVIAGWACQMRPDQARRRQIFGFLLPGDVIGSVWGPAEFTFYQTTALTMTLTLGLAELVAMGRTRPQVLRAARRAESHAQHRLFDHIVRLGARDAYAGLAHLLLELHARLRGMGLAEDDAFVLPIGQRVLAQAMGFSLVHTNQTLKRMGGDGLLALEGARVRLLQRARMAALCQFTDGAAYGTEGSTMNGLHDQPQVHAYDGGGQRVAGDLDPWPVDEAAHQRAVAGEHH